MAAFSFLPGAWQPTVEFVLKHLEMPRFHPLRLQRFPRGVDNAHIDVALHARLRGTSAALIDTLIREDVQRSFWGQAIKAPNIEAEQAFAKVYVELTRTVVNAARATSRTDSVQLFQLAVWRMFLAQADRALASLRRELDEARAQPARQISGQSLELHDRAVALARNQETIRYRCLAALLRLVMRLESGPLRKVRKTVLGVSWPLAETMLSSPVIQLAGRGTAADFMAAYPMACRDLEWVVGVNRIVLHELRNWLPDEVVPPQGAGDAEMRVRHDQGGLLGYVDTERAVRRLAADGELDEQSGHWLDVPDNLVRLLGGTQGLWPDTGEWRMRRFAGFQKRLLRRIEKALHRANLLEPLYASHELAALPKSSLPAEAIEPVFDFLRGATRKRELSRKLDNVAGLKDKGALLKQLEGLRRERGRDRMRDIHWVVGALGDFARYRRDLKVAWWMYRGMDSLRVLQDEQELDLSRANGLLQDFSGIGGAEQQQRAVGHVIIKADVRGSTRITSQMLEKGQNPASYFSRNLYAPINALLEGFGAEKVFVEGDAVIIAIMEFETGLRKRPAVAMACGLARKILEVVEAQNAESRRLDLPLLELGLGIAYSDQPPAYLYDDGHKITISDAINKADRLSSCNSELRALNPRGDAGERGVEVVTPLQSGAGMDTLVRYNVNGIELDAPAFSKLKSELAIKAISMPTGPSMRGGAFHVGRYADARGNAHWLVVREAPVRLWMGNELIAQDNTTQQFYEVLTDREAVTRVLTHMKLSVAQAKSGGDGGMRGR